MDEIFWWAKRSIWQPRLQKCPVPWWGPGGSHTGGAGHAWCAAGSGRPGPRTAGLLLPPPSVSVSEDIKINVMKSITEIYSKINSIFMFFITDWRKKWWYILVKLFLCVLYLSFLSVWLELVEEVQALNVAALACPTQPLLRLPPVISFKTPHAAWSGSPCKV